MCHVECGRGQKATSLEISLVCSHCVGLIYTLPFDAHCCHMGTAIKHPVPDRVKLVICNFDIWVL